MRRYISQYIFLVSLENIFSIINQEFFYGFPNLSLYHVSGGGLESIVFTAMKHFQSDSISELKIENNDTEHNC